tara:strand:- start:143 stop:610 length:468 start_codon:yes stop_codon:yes gene_type:complete
MSIQTGSIAPDFSLASSSGKTVSLSDFRGQTVIVYFYPKDDTPGCTKEACSFRDTYDALSNAGVTVLGISPDSVESHNKFIEKFNLNFQLLSDPDKSTAQNYGAWGEKNMYGKIVVGMKRMSFLVNPEGTVQHVWSKVKTESHGQDVLTLIQGMY